MDRFERLRQALEAYPHGVHQLGSPCVLLDAAMPEIAAELYRCFDGLGLFFGALTIGSASEARLVGDAWRIGEVDGDELLVLHDGSVLLAEKDTGERLREGSRLDRWLLGWIEAQALLFDDEGEYLEDVFDESGEVTAQVMIRMLRSQLKRDPAACSPRWRLARALSRGADDESDRDARVHLEQVVGTYPDFGWAWYDLGRISERLGEVDNAVDELEAAGDADPDYDHAAFFWAHAARAAARAGDEARRAELSARSLKHSPDLARAQREAALHELKADEVEAALELAELAAALAPRDLAVIDLLANVRRRHDAEPPDRD